MDYYVILVDDDQLEGQPWALARRGESIYMILTRGAAACAEVLARAWAAARMVVQPRLALPTAV